MLCLGIESSCDETGLALAAEGRITASVLASQIPVHALFNGVVPELASREHCRLIGPLFDALLERAQIAASEIDVIAVARGPGLLGSLLVGSAFAKGLALALQRPLIAVNHLHAHLLAAAIGREQIFPGIGLVVSGGHTDIYYMRSPWQFERLGRTLDDAAGEVFDKVGCRLGFAYPAGKALDEAAHKASARGLLPLPYINNENLDFSFSGLKTAALAAHANGLRDVAGLASELNMAVAGVLAAKAERAFASHPEARSLYVAGGVAANSAVRAKMSELAATLGVDLLLPAQDLCCDNGAMIAYAGLLLAEAGFSHGLDYEAIPRGRKIPDDMKHNSGASQ